MIIRWPRDLWLDALWDSETVKPNERCVAYVYARYAGDTDIAWCTDDELKRRTGIKSRNGLWLAKSGLVEAGWLRELEKAKQYRSARYKLTIPEIGEEMQRPQTMDRHLRSVRSDVL